MAATRIYAVFDNGTILALVRTTNPARALQHCIGDRFEAVLADQDMLLKYGAEGMVPQEAPLPTPKTPKAESAATPAPKTTKPANVEAPKAGAPK